MIAGLHMYDRPQTADANDRFWALIRAGLAERDIAAPQTLTRGFDPWELWQNPDLVLSQTCGLPYRSRLHGKVSLVATPVHDLPCEPGYYFSVILTRRDDKRARPAEFDGARLAINGAGSQSGWAAPVGWAAEHGISFGSIFVSGGHGASAQAVASGEADLAAIDALTWQMIKRWDSVADDLKELDRTEPTPALPYIAATGADTGAAYDALAQAVAGLGAEDRAVLGLHGITRIGAEDYLAVATPPPPQV